MSRYILCYGFTLTSARTRSRAAGARNGEWGMRNRPREIMIITPTGGTAAHMRYPGFRTLRVPKAHHVPRASCCSYTLYTLGSRPGGDIPSTKRDQRDLREQPLCCSRQRANSISAPPLYDLWRVALHATILLYTMSIVVGCVLTTRVPYRWSYVL